MQQEQIVLFFISPTDQHDIFYQCIEYFKDRHVNVHAAYYIHLTESRATLTLENICFQPSHVKIYHWTFADYYEHLSKLVHAHQSFIFPLYCVLGSLPTPQTIQVSGLLKKCFRPVDKLFYFSDQKMMLQEIIEFNQIQDQSDNIQKTLPNLMPLTFYPENCMIKIGDVCEFRLPHFQFILYQFFAGISLQRPDNIPSSDYFIYFVPGGSNFPDWAWQSLSSLYGKPVIPDWNRIQQEISKIKRELTRNADSYSNLDYYHICAFGPWGASRYGIKLDKSLITIKNTQPC